MSNIWRIHSHSKHYGYNEDLQHSVNDDMMDSFTDRCVPLVYNYVHQSELGEIRVSDGLCELMFQAETKKYM